MEATISSEVALVDYVRLTKKFTHLVVEHLKEDFGFIDPVLFERTLFLTWTGYVNLN